VGKGHAWIISGLLVGGSLVGCASPMSALRDDNRRLSNTVGELRAERRAHDRKMRDLQHQLDQIRAQVVTQTVDAMPPNLPVEVATPNQPTTTPGSRVVGVTEAGEEIVYEGDAASGKPATLDDEPPPTRTRPNPPPPIASASDRLGVTDDRLEVTSRRAPVRARAARVPVRTSDQPSERSGDAGNEYRVAVDLVKAGQHDQAVAALRAFIAKYPRHDYADNAQYWLGETHYARKDYAQALVEFRTVIETYPRGNKVPDALLKVGYCYQSLGQTEKARAVLEQVVSLYPKTEPAALAAKRLESK
jgi:tol-pal system protein YbgF